MIQLGLIPSYQFSSDPSENPYGVNPHVKFPPGMSQLTIQPVSRQWPTSGDVQLGTPIISQVKTPVGVNGLGIFTSTWWQQRKWIAFGVLGLLALGVGAAATKILR